MKIREFSITFHTNKIKECVDFYGKYFQAIVTFDAGWYVSIRFDSDPSKPIYLSFQGCNEEMIKESLTVGVTLNLMTEDVDACYERLKQKGISFSEEITDHEWGDRAFSVKDPIGNIVYVYSERELHEKYKNAVKE